MCSEYAFSSKTTKKMQTKMYVTIALLVGILTSFMRNITYGQDSTDPEPFDFKKKTNERSFCKMTDTEVNNNKRDESRTYVEMKIHFLTEKNYKTTPTTTKEESQFSNFRTGIRKSCNGKQWEGAEWFNNTKWQFKEGAWYWLTPTGPNTNPAKTEKQCYEEFLDFAKNEQSYTGTKNPYLQKNRFETFMESNVKEFTGEKDAIINNLITGKVQQQNRKKVTGDIEKNIKRFAILYGIQEPTPLTFGALGNAINGKKPNIQKLVEIIESISNKAQSEMTNSDIRRLQVAINTLGCDRIMVDGALGNYTIKSFCVCSIAITKPEEKCIDILENTSDIGKFKIKENPTTIVNDICEVFTDQKIGWLTIGNLFCQLKKQVTIGNTTFDAWQAVGFCCTWWLSVKKLTPPQVTQETYSCCIDPSKEEDVSKCKNQQEIKNATACGPGYDLLCQLDDSWNIKVPFCPCPSGEHRVKKQGEGTTSFKCPCVNPSECIEFYTDEGWNKVDLSIGDTCWPNQGAKAKYCRTTQNWPIKEICPCQDSPDKNREKKWEKDFQCPCPINNPTDLTSKCDEQSLSSKTTLSPGDTCTSKEDPKKQLTICYCNEDKKGYVKKDWKWICDDCKPGTRRDKKKEKCVCDQSYAAVDPNHCCGIKLNTNVPWIGRCILFGNTNNKDRDWTNTYGNGNTTITVNVLNTFPLLMGALGKILLTVILLAWFGMLIRWGVQRASSNEGSRSGTSWWKAMIAKVAIWLALIGASGVILHAINPNFFQ